MRAPRRPGRGLVRPYVVTGGRAHPTRNTFDLVTLVIAQHDRPLDLLSPEKRRLMELSHGGALSLAEIASHLELPIAVTKVLLSDLVDSGHVITRAPVPAAERPDIDILQEVLDGLRRTLR